MSGPDMHAHRERESLGAYLLGALDPAERQALDRHLATCTQCREELARLSAVRPLLDRLDLHDVEATAVAPPVDGAVHSIARFRRRQRRVLRAWQAATVAACLAAVGTVVATSGSPQPVGTPLALSEVTSAGAGVEGSARARSVAWGTAVALELTSLPVHDAYQVWVVGDGLRQLAGSWGPTAAGRANVSGASGIPTSEIVRIEITDGTGMLLVSFVPIIEQA